MPNIGSRHLGPDVPTEQRQIDLLLATVKRLQGEFKDRSTAEAEWGAERQLLRAMVDHVPDYLFVKDLECRFIIVNKAVAHIHGAPDPDWLIGKTDFDLHAFDHDLGKFCLWKSHLGLSRLLIRM
jgi:PAS domain-containing protein